MIWFYKSLLGQRGTIEIDINYMYRETLWPIKYREPNIMGYSDWKGPVLDIHEIAAGKLAALFERSASRDLYDAHHFLTALDLNQAKLRLAFVVYIAMTEIDLNKLTIESVSYDLVDLKNRLFPVLQQTNLPRARPKLQAWISNLLTELKEKLTILLPLRSNETEFIEQIRDSNQILPELLTNNTDLAKKISVQPALLWAGKRALSKSE